MASGAAFGLPLCAVAVLVARAFGSAAARYRVYAVAFTAAALYAPLALVFSLVRPASVAPLGGSLEEYFAAHGPLALASIAGAVAALLLCGLTVDLVALLRIKAGSRIDAGFIPSVRGAALASSPRVETPTAIGYLHPRILVPDDLLARVSPSELRAIIAHEHAHLTRFDDWAKAVQAAVARAFWFAPALWMLAARLDLERELASDERVLRAAVDPHEYATCLIRLAADVHRPLPAPAAWLGRSQIAVRVERLLRPRAHAGRLAATARVGVLTLAVLATGAGAVIVVPAQSRTIEIASASPAPPIRSSNALRSATLPMRAQARPNGTHLRYHVASVPRARVVVPAEPRAAARVGQTDVAFEPSVALPGCRTCVFFRRPFVGWPAASAARQPKTQLRARTWRGSPHPLGDVDDRAGSRGHPWDPSIAGDNPSSVLLGPG